MRKRITAVLATLALSACQIDGESLEEPGAIDEPGAEANCIDPATEEVDEDVPASVPTVALDLGGGWFVEWHETGEYFTVAEITPPSAMPAHRAHEGFYDLLPTEQWSLLTDEPVPADLAAYEQRMAAVRATPADQEEDGRYCTSGSSAT